MVLRDLRHSGGGFYSAEDADSEGVEGKFYVWSEPELRAVVRAAAGDGAADAAVAWWGVTAAGNFEGSNILNRPVRGDLLRPDPVEAARQALFICRESRVRPGLDDKVLTEWNGLMLAALVEAAAATGDPEWRAAALANGEFLVGTLRRDDGRWLRSWQAGDSDRPAQARHLAYAHDYAALIDAFTRLGELSGQARWIDEARAAADGLLELFWDDDAGGVFTTGSDAEELVTRPKDLMDNATPSAQSLAACGLLRLAALTGETRYDEHAPPHRRPVQPRGGPASHRFRPGAGSPRTWLLTASTRSRWSATGPTSWAQCRPATCRVRSWPGASPTTPRCGPTGPRASPTSAATSPASPPPPPPTI